MIIHAIILPIGPYTNWNLPNYNLPFLCSFNRDRDFCFTLLRYQLKSGDTNWKQLTPQATLITKEENEWNNSLEFFLASQRLGVDFNTPIHNSLVHILLLYGETGNLGSETNFSQPNPPGRVGTHSTPK